MSQDKEASKNGGGGAGVGGDEERWIESDWLHVQEKEGSSTTQDENDDPPDVTDLFADPDPMDTFEFSWTIHDMDECCIDVDVVDVHDEESSRSTPSPPPARRQKQQESGTIHIRLEGYKAELGQTLHSTGLTLWRASQILSDHLVAHARSEIYGKRVVELGAGMGLCGILASHLGAASVLLTDGDTDALAQLRRNVQANCGDIAPGATSSFSSGDNNMIRHDVTCRQLVWGRSLDQFVSDHGLFDIVLGSDIIYVPEIIEPLFETMERIMTNDATFILAYARRNVPIDLVLDHAKQRGWGWTCPGESAEGVFCFQRATRRDG